MRGPPAASPLLSDAFAATPADPAAPDTMLHRDGDWAIVTRIALAGDYLIADYPATLEAAVRSGLTAASRLARASCKTQDSSDT